jgi:SAM-dependent methyltransferase
MSDFGDSWRTAGSGFWDDMWAVHRNSALTQWLIQEPIIKGYERIIEIGCGSGHIITETVKRGWRGTYIGIDISETAVSAALQRFASELSTVGDEDAFAFGFQVGDYLDIASAPDYASIANYTFCRGVLRHQPHWAPLVVTALRFTPRLAVVLGSVTEDPYHQIHWDHRGHYDGKISLPRLKTEAVAMGLHIEAFMTRYNTVREQTEALVVFSRPLCRPRSSVRAG